MSQQHPTQRRPAQVTAAGLIVMLGSVFVILLMWDRIAHLHSTGTQTSLQDFLDRSQLDSRGFDVAALTTVVKLLSMTCAALAVATAVQGHQVGKRSRSARIAVTVLAVPLFVTGLVGDGFVGSAAATFWCSGVAAAVLTLWLGPARIWFGDSLPTPQAPPPPAPQVALPPAPWAPPSTSAYDVVRAPGARPRTLLWACVLTWVCTGLASIGLALSVAMLSADPHSMLDEVYRQNPGLADQGLSRHAVLATLITLCVVALVASLAAGVFAVLLFLRQRWAWYALVISASAAAVLFLVGAFGSPVAIVMLAACVATIAFLVRPEVKAWALGR